MEFEIFKQENQELIDFLNNLGFEESQYDDIVYFDFIYGDNSFFDALIYDEKHGICLYSAPQNFHCETKIVKTIQDARNIFNAFKQSQHEKIKRSFL